MRIGEVAAKSGIPASTLRYYERIGLLEPPHRIGGQRHYEDNILDTLRLIQLAKRHKFTLDDIRVLLNNCSGNHTVADTWRDIAKDKLTEVQAKIAKYQAIEATLNESLTCECDNLDTCDLVA